jgi:hypothetical protein
MTHDIQPEKAKQDTREQHVTNRFAKPLDFEELVFHQLLCRQSAVQKNQRSAVTHQAFSMEIPKFL